MRKLNAITLLIAINVWINEISVPKRVCLQTVSEEDTFLVLKKKKRPFINHRYCILAVWVPEVTTNIRPTRWEVSRGGARC
jgi:hypothetical protein